MRIEGRALLRVALSLALVSPLLIGLTYVSRFDWPSLNWLGAIGPSLLQACLSTGLALALGIVLARALLGTTKRQTAEMALLLPSAIPPLFLVLALLGLTRLPPGWCLVMIAHVWLGSGLAAVALARLCENKAATLAEVAWIAGAKRAQIVRGVIWPTLRVDVLTLALSLFAMFLTSFSIPLLLGGTHAQSAEILIYKLIAQDGRWDQALALAVIQTAFLFGLGWLVPPLGTSATRTADLRFLRGRVGRGLCYVPALALGCGWAVALRQAEVSLAFRGFLPALLLSLGLGFAVGLTQLILFMAAAFAGSGRTFTRALTAWTGPGGAIVGFAFLRVPGAPFIALTLALALTSFTLLYRWQVRASLGALDSQIAVARTLGAGWGAIFGTLVWPQAGPAMLRAAGLAGVWASGDYALSGILLPNGASLPLLARDLLNHYQTGSATLIMIPYVGAAALIYIFFAGAGRYVCR